MAKIISAEFDSVDLAELAARNIRYKFEGISKIKIKYRNIEDRNYWMLPSAAAMNGAYGPDYPQSYGAVGAVGFDEEEHTEADENRASRLIIEASDNTAARVASYLRGLGGLGIKVSFVP